MSLQGVIQLLVTGITTGAVYALIALGFVAVFAVTRIINFAQGEFVMLGALIMVTLTRTAGWPPVLGFAGTVLIVGIIGGAIYRLALHPARRSTPVTLIIITVGAAMALRGLALLGWGTHPYSLPPFTAGPPLWLAGAAVRLQSLWVLGILAAVLALLYVFFDRTLLGKGLRACAINPRAAEWMGVDVDRMRLLSFTLAGMLGAVAGAVVAPISLATYDMGLGMGLKGFAAAIVGGLVNPAGAVVGGLLLGTAEALTAGLVSSSFKDAVAFVVLIGVLLARPRRLLPETRQEVGL